jgi:DNA-binding XRE family transcriptional regulator
MADTLFPPAVQGQSHESVVDWAGKPEPWRTVGLGFVAELERIAAGRPHDIPMPARIPDRHGQAVKARRLALGLKQWQLAAAAGLKRDSSICQIERGHVQPSQRVLDALLRLEAER